LTALQRYVVFGPLLCTAATKALLIAPSALPPAAVPPGGEGVPPEDG
jgi:hypothetical protein